MRLKNGSTGCSYILSLCLMLEKEKNKIGNGKEIELTLKLQRFRIIFNYMAGGSNI